MNNLWNIVAQIAFELPPERLRLMIDKIADLPSVQEIDKIKKVWGANFDEQLYQHFVEVLTETPTMTGRELSIAFHAATASVAYSDTKGHTELLWTGPKTATLPMRYTEQALCELISSATRKIFIVSFVAYKADNVIAVLAEALMRNVQISFLLEASQDNGGTLLLDSFAKLKEALPSATFYTWDTAKKPRNAVVHAKCAVADESMALITSANLTGMAMEANMECGIFIKGGSLSAQLSRHLEALVTERIIVPVVSNGDLLTHFMKTE